MVGSKSSGLDIDLGNHCSALAYGWARRTFDTRRGLAGMPLAGMDGQFSNVMDFGGVRIAMTSDGIGTKTEIAERTGIYDTLGWDLVAMVVDDLAANGIEPVNLTNILDVDRLDADIVDKLMKGLHDAARAANIAVVGGEIAELGNRIGGWGNGMHFNWCAAALGMLQPGQDPVDGSRIRPGDVVIALRSRGFRSNGFSLVRKVLEGELGPNWHDARFDADHTWGQVTLTPSRLFCPLITHLRQQGFDLHGISHITGGGIPDKFARILKGNKLGAYLPNLFPPHPFMLRLQEMGNIPEEQVYRLWNMGNGMLLVVDPGDVWPILMDIHETGYEAMPAGVVLPDPVIRIVGKGARAAEITYDRAPKA